MRPKPKTMNITELARILKMTPNDLREKLPQLGFDIGQKAIKIDPVMAQKILREWPFLVRKLQQAGSSSAEKVKIETIVEPEKKTVKIPKIISVRDFAALINLPINKVLAELMKNGVFTSINERIDFDTAAIIGDGLGFEIKLDEEQKEEAAENQNDKKIEENLGQESEENLVARPPVIVVMGHVDHGKTKLLDAIRQTDVAAGEAGGITQHIGAYQVTRKNRRITFIDTPGHEAFTAMRSRGAKIADVAILVVAADDGVQPQTIEAFKIIQAAGLPFIIAVNKIDKPTADLNKAKQDFVNKLNILPEDWGGKTVCAPISALKGTGIDELLDLILLTADAEAKNMKANPKSPAIGTIIESRMDKNSGPISTLLVQNGTLRIGDQIILRGKIIGKTRAMKNYKGEEIKEALPSEPVRILGIKIAPAVGDVLEVGEGERVKSGLEKLAARPVLAAAAREEAENDTAKKLNLIIKSDVLGSAEAIEESLLKLNNEEIKIKIISKGLGNITEGDLSRAEGAEARLLGFNVKITPQIETLLREKTVIVKTFNIIYDLIKYVKEEMQKISTPKFERVNLGRLKVLGLFRTENKSQVVGGKVLDGQAKSGVPVEVFRDKELIALGKAAKLQIGKMDMPTVERDQECGVQYEGKPVIQEGDILQFYEDREIAKKI